MATYPSVLAWRIPWMEEPGGLQSMGSLRVRHNWATSLSLSCIGEGNGTPLQCSCLENPRDGGAWWAAVYGVAQSWTRLKRLSSSSSSRFSKESFWFLNCIFAVSTGPAKEGLLGTASVCSEQAAKSEQQENKGGPPDLPCLLTSCTLVLPEALLNSHQPIQYSQFGQVLICVSESVFYSNLCAFLIRIIIFLHLEFILFLKLTYRGFTVSVSFRYTAQWFSYTYVCVSKYIFFFRFFSLIGYYKNLSIVPCAIQ